MSHRPRPDTRRPALDHPQEPTIATIRVAAPTASGTTAEHTYGTDTSDTTYHVRDSGRLDITDGTRGTMASYAPGAWLWTQDITARARASQDQPT